MSVSVCTPPIRRRIRAYAAAHQKSFTWAYHALHGAELYAPLHVLASAYGAAYLSSAVPPMPGNNFDWWNLPNLPKGCGPNKDAVLGESYKCMCVSEVPPNGEPGIANITHEAPATSLAWPTLQSVYDAAAATINVADQYQAEFLEAAEKGSLEAPKVKMNPPHGGSKTLSALKLAVKLGNHAPLPLQHSNINSIETHQGQNVLITLGKSDMKALKTVMDEVEDLKYDDAHKIHLPPYAITSGGPSSALLRLLTAFGEAHGKDRTWAWEELSVGTFFKMPLGQLDMLLNKPYTIPNSYRYMWPKHLSFLALRGCSPQEPDGAKWNDWPCKCMSAKSLAKPVEGTERKVGKGRQVILVAEKDGCSLIVPEGFRTAIV